jgi:hypothetical protein
MYKDGSWTGGSTDYGYFGIQFKDRAQKHGLTQEIIFKLEERILGYHRVVERIDIAHSDNYGPGLNVHSIKNPQAFFRAINIAKSNNEHGAFVHTYDESEYEKMKLFLVNAGAAGMAVKEGDIVSVFKNPDMARKDLIERINNVLLVEALKNGGERLDCFDGFLPELYARFGFTPVARLGFNDDFAPEHWNFDRDGRPNIIFMAHSGDSLEEVLRKQKEKAFVPYSKVKDTVPFAESYDQASEMVSEFLRSRDDKSRELNKSHEPKIKMS